ncbi:hypothetical protein CFP56_039717 [Quercus suber]|uniref:Uncharacterized protein n=1 Tax=Quercus suber TaxID=58331 RepID=A0AAW0M9S3_QUESU
MTCHSSKTELLTHHQEIQRATNYTVSKQHRQFRSTHTDSSVIGKGDTAHSGRRTHLGFKSDRGIC